MALKRGEYYVMKQCNHRVSFGVVAFIAILCALGTAADVNAQVDTASLKGAITDAKGGVIAGARVAVVNRATNISLETTTKEDGYYTFSNLRPGVYEITVEQAGFKRETRSALQLSIGQRARLDFSLTVGQVTEAVTVT